MSDAFKDVSTVPTLTLEPFQAEEEKKPAVQPEEPKLDDTILTEEERRMVDAFAQQIDLTNSSMILQYGAGTQKKMADFSESALENVKSKDLGEVGTLLTNVVTELKSFDEEESKGFLGIFKKASNKVESMKAKYSKAEENVNQQAAQENRYAGGTGSGVEPRYHQPRCPQVHPLLHRRDAPAFEGGTDRCLYSGNLEAIP